MNGLAYIEPKWNELKPEYANTDILRINRLHTFVAGVLFQTDGDTTDNEGIQQHSPASFGGDVNQFAESAGKSGYDLSLIHI